MENHRILLWLRDSGVTGLVGRTWAIKKTETTRGDVDIAHADPLCRKLQSQSTIRTATAELEELEEAKIAVCYCIYDALGGNSEENVHIGSARIRISLETLENLRNDPSIDEEGRYPMMRAAALHTAHRSERQRWQRQPEPPVLTPAMLRLATCWQDAVDSHPLDWQVFDENVVEKAAHTLTRAAIWESISMTDHVSWQIDQSVAAHWMGLGPEFKRSAADLVAANDPSVLERFATWDRLLAENLADTEPRALYIGSLESDPSQSLPDLRSLIIHRGLRSGMTASHCGFAVVPNVVARNLDLKSRWVSDGNRPTGGAVTLLEKGLPDLDEHGWRTALLLWEESFADQDDPGPYREFTAAIEAAAHL